MIKRLQLVATLFLGAVLSLNAQTPKLNWVSVQDGQGIEIGQTIDKTTDGNAVIMSNFNTKKEYPSTEYALLSLSDGSKTVEKSLYGAPDTFENNGNTNMAVYKVNAETGNLMWSITTNIGGFGEGYMTSTPDNGVVLLLKMRHTSRGAMYKDTLCQFVDKDSTLTTIKLDYPTDFGHAPYFPVLVKIAANGKIEWAKHFDVKYGSWNVKETAVDHTDNFDLGGMVSDAEGNIYFSGIYRTAINFGEKANFTNARNAADWDGDTQNKRGDLFVVKMNDKGEAVWGATTSGDAIQCESPKGMTIEGQHLYVSGYMKGDNKSSVNFGNNKVVPAERKSLFVTELSTENGQFAWTKLLHSANNEGCTKSDIKPMGLSFAEGQLYIYGSFQGDVKDGEKIVLSSSIKKLNSFILQCNATDGAVLNAIHINNPENANAILEIEACGVIGNKVYATGYDLFAESYIYAMDKQLSAESLETYTVKNSAMGTSQAATFIGNKIINVTRLKNTATLPGFDWTYNAIETGNSNWACMYTCHTIDADATGITTIQPNGPHGATVIYDLSGRRVAKATKGLYIINGKKVFVR